MRSTRVAPGERGDRNSDGEEERSGAGVHLGHRLVIEQNPRSAEGSLHHHQQDRRCGQCPNGRARARPPDDSRQQQRDQSDERPEESMSMLQKQIPRAVQPFGQGKQKHIVAIGGGPIGHRHGGVERGDQRAEAEQHRRHRYQEAGDSVGPVDGASGGAGHR